MLLEEALKQVQEHEAQNAIMGTQQGILYPNGSIAWDSAYETRILEKSERDRIRREYANELRRLGIPEQDLIFVTRESVTTYSRPVLIE